MQLWPPSLLQKRLEYTKEKRQPLQQVVASSATWKRMKLEYSLTPYTKINSKWTKDLNVRPDTTKLIEENIGRTLFDINHRNIFFELSLTVMKIKTKINKGT